MTTSVLPPEGTVYEWDSEVRRHTSNFHVDGTTIVIQIGDGTHPKTFKVASALLANHLPSFRNMMEASIAEPVVVVHNDPNDFEDFLWFIHADAISFLSYTKKCPGTEKFRRALGIGSVANFYDATDIADWAIGELVGRIDLYATPALLPRLHKFSEDCRDISPGLHQSVIAKWRKVIQTTPDPVAGLLSAKEVHDHYLQSHAYFCILGVSTETLAADHRLTILDRVRLTLGSMNLRRYCVGCDWQQQQFTARCACPAQESYDGRSLWTLFTQSDMGYSLADSSLDLSFLALSESRQNDVKVEPLLP